MNPPSSPVLDMNRLRMLFRQLFDRKRLDRARCKLDARKPFVGVGLHERVGE